MERGSDDRIGCGPMTLALPVIALMLACGISEVKQDAGKEPVIDELELPDRAVCCVTGVEFPSGYDWNKHEEGGEVKSSLVVFADAVPCLKVPVGAGFEVSGDPDMNRFLEGNLYSFYSDDGVSSIKKNGSPLYRYDADEILLDMLVKGEDLYILTRKVEGGFSCRKNASVILEKFSGEAFGRLWEDDGCVCFAYMQPVAVSDGMEARYYVVRDSDVMHVPFEKEVVRVWDIMSKNGEPCCLVSISYDVKTYIVQGSQYKAVEIPASACMLSCRLFDANGRIGVECVYESGTSDMEGGIWIEGSEYLRFEVGRQISYLCCGDGKVCCVMNPEESGGSVVSKGMIYDGENLHDMPDGYFCTGLSPASVFQSELYVALSSRSGERPVVWHDGQLDTLKMNGYVSSVEIVNQGPSPYK